ncbi:hypothetical protein HDU98_002888 [Podochytrium sp. JEL0797]|nr:hypothetical protein HDU98_002888 [Podochytrium sp. JEL0797]
MADTSSTAQSDNAGAKPYTPECPFYLEASFDPSKATVPELKTILLDCNVAFPTHRALKEEYVVLFQQHVAPRTAHLLALLKNKKPSSRGIQRVVTEPIRRKSDENEPHEDPINIPQKRPLSTDKSKSHDEDKRPKTVPHNPQPLPLPPQSPQRHLQNTAAASRSQLTREYLKDLPPPMRSPKPATKKPVSLSLAKSRIPKLSPKPSSSSASQGSSSSSSASSSGRTSPSLKTETVHHFNILGDPKVVTESPATMTPTNPSARSSLGLSALGSVEEDDESQPAVKVEDEGDVDSDYSDVLDAYGNSLAASPPSRSGTVTPVPEFHHPKPIEITEGIFGPSSMTKRTPLRAALDKNLPPAPTKLEFNSSSDEDDENAPRFSPDPRRVSHHNRTPRQTPGGGEILHSPRRTSLTPQQQSTGSPLLTKTLKQRLKRHVMETGKHRSSPGSAVGAGVGVRGGSEEAVHRGRTGRSVRGSVQVFSSGFSDGEAEEEDVFYDPFGSPKKPNDGIDASDQQHQHLTASRSRTKCSQLGGFLVTCLFITCYALLVPPLFMLSTWYLETGSTLQFCDPTSAKANADFQWSQIVTAKDLMDFWMPSCLECPAGAVCRGDRVVGCVNLDGIGEQEVVGLEKEMGISGAFWISQMGASVCESGVGSASEGHYAESASAELGSMYPEVSIQVRSSNSSFNAEKGCN